MATGTSYRYTANCRYLDGLQRIDIKVVQDWLKMYGVSAPVEEIPVTMR